MAWIIRHYLDVHPSGRPVAFTSRAAALAYLVGVVEDAERAEFDIDGDPLDGIVTAGGATYVLSECTDLHVLRRCRAGSPDPSRPQLP